MADVTHEPDPKNFVFFFFRTLMMSQCHTSFSMLTETSQKRFIQWVQEDMYRRKPEACKAARIGPKEVRMLMEINDSTVMKTFWKYFYQKSRCYDMVYNGIYRNENVTTSSAEVIITFQSPNGPYEVVFKIVKKGPIWKFAYIESEGPI
jgi:hypothetical protein